MDLKESKRFKRMPLKRRYADEHTRKQVSATPSHIENTLETGSDLSKTRKVNPKNHQSPIIEQIWALLQQLHDLLLIDVVAGYIAKLPSTTRFIALSYVWGLVPTLRCTTTNFSMLSIPNALYARHIADILPETIGNAICLVRRLGEQYVCVDSFCVMQDSDAEDFFVVNSSTNTTTGSSSSTTSLATPTYTTFKYCFPLPPHHTPHLYGGEDGAWYRRGIGVVVKEDLDRLGTVFETITLGW